MAVAVKPEPPVTRFAMTVDVEEWFTGIADRPDQIAGFASRLDVGLQRVLDLLERTGTRATFFFLGYLAERSPRWVRAIADRGHELGVHGHHHIPLWQLSPASFRAEAVRARQVLLEAGAPAVSGYRAPLFSIDRRTSWAFDVLEEIGFEYSSSVFPIRNPRYGFPGAPRLPFPPTATGRFVEFPISTVGPRRLALPFSGGFYLRALPRAAVTRGFAQLADKQMPAVCYLHSWELDGEQPRLPAGPLTRLRHTVGLRGVERTMEALLRRFRFAPMREVLRDLAPTRRPRRLPLAPPPPAPPG